MPRNNGAGSGRQFGAAPETGGFTESFGRFSAFVSPRHRCHGEKKQRRFHSGDISFTVSWYGRSTGNLTAFPEPVGAPSANAVPGQGSRRCFSYPPPWGDMSFRFSPCRRWLGILACFPAASAMGGRLRLAVLGTLHRFDGSGYSLASARAVRLPHRW